MVGLRVLNCEGRGYKSDIIAALDWIEDNFVAPAVVTMSLGGAHSVAENAAVDALVDSGVVVVTAAGNDSTDACTSSPASAVQALTVGSTDIAGDSDGVSSFSNYGTCLDIWAPGSDIVSAGISSDTAVDTKNGTSMACPLAAGVAAQYLEMNPTHDPTTVMAHLLNVATPKSAEFGLGGSPRVMLYSRLYNGATIENDSSYQACLASASTCTELFLNDDYEPGYIQLTGTIPTELGEMTSLQFLALSRNSLSFTIPTELGEMRSLQVLDLGHNSLTDTIPTEMGLLTRLKGLYFNSNSLSGPIPTELGELTNLFQLWFDSNSLSGPIPTELVELASLEAIGDPLRLHSNAGLCGEVVSIGDFYYDTSGTNLGSACQLFLVVSGACTLSSDGTCFRSPNYPSNYDINQQCTITVAAFQAVTLSVTAFDLEAQSSCAFDYLAVNGVKYCGTSGPDDVLVAADQTITFTSDELITRSGFEICGAFHTTRLP